MKNDITTPIVSLLTQTASLLEQLSCTQYSTSLDVLSGASIGQHTRHILGFYLTLITQYETGTLNYDARPRDRLIETDRESAILQLQYIVANIEKNNKPLTLISRCDAMSQNTFTVDTNYDRELLYNLEHAVHHMAFIRIGVHAISSIVLDEDFGVAASTIQYRKACVQ